MGCSYDEHWAFGEVDGPIGDECHCCDSVCFHNDRYNYEFDCLDPDPALMDDVEEN
jgi:hypothetical protein